MLMKALELGFLKQEVLLLPEEWELQLRLQRERLLLLKDSLKPGSFCLKLVEIRLSANYCKVGTRRLR